ncbi:MAG: hypothetical protein JNL90_03045 [Planctomycetes bacterium]|nr:hypothetical protein [Planctomycetota bacterium]
MVMEDLYATCAAIRRDADRGAIGHEINHKIFRPNAKAKALDLVIGQPRSPLAIGPGGLRRAQVVTPGARVILEAKACMTAHSKALPRLHDELLSAMRTSIECTPRAVMCGLVVVNIGRSFVSTENQRNVDPTDSATLKRNAHNQPRDAAKVIDQLQATLPIRAEIGELGFDCLAFIVVDHDNEVPSAHVTLCDSHPAPPANSPRDYGSFLVDVCNRYRERFGD